MSYISLAAGTDSAKLNKNSITLGEENLHVDRVEWNELVNGLRGKAVAGKHFIGAGGMTADPFPFGSVPAGLGTGRTHLWWDDTDDAFTFRESGVNLERRVLDDQGVGVYQQATLGAEPAVAPAGKARFYYSSALGVWRHSINTGAWADMITAGGGAGDIEGVTAGAGLTGGGTTGTVSLAVGAGTGITVNADDVQVEATFYAKANGLPASGGAVGDLLVHTDTAVAWGRIAAPAVGQMLISAGVSTAPAWSAAGVLTSLTLTSGSSMKLLAWTSDTKYLAFAEASATPSYRGIKGQEGSGTDIVGGALYLGGGQGTGTGRGGHVVLQTSTGTTTGSTLRVLVDRWMVLGGDATNTYSGHFVPATTNVYDIGTPTVGDLSGVYVRSTYVATSMNAPKWADSSDSTTHLAFASGVQTFTSGGTARHKVSASYSRYAFGAAHADSSAFEVVTNTADARGRFQSTSSTGVGGDISTNDAGWSLTTLIDGSGTTRSGVTGGGYFIGLSTPAHFGALTNTDSHWITGTADSSADRVASAIYNAGNRYLKIGYFVEYTEMSAPAAGAANTGRVFLVDNGSGKSVLKCQFATGAAQAMATEP